MKKIKKYLVLLFLVLPLLIFSNNDLKKEFWNEFENKNFSKAREVALTLSLKSPAYLELAIYSDFFSYTDPKKDFIEQEIYKKKSIIKNYGDDVLKDIDSFCIKDSYEYIIGKSIILFHAKRKNDEAIDLVTNLSKEHNDYIVNFLLYMFTHEADYLKKSIEQNNLFVIGKVLLTGRLLSDEKPNPEVYTLLMDLISQKNIRYSINFYPAYIVRGLAGTPVRVGDGGFAPGGPSGKPISGILYMIHDDNWKGFEEASTINKLYLALAFEKYGNGVNRKYVDKILTYLSEQEKIDHNKIIKVLDIFKILYETKYDKVFLQINEILNDPSLNYKDHYLLLDTLGNYLETFFYTQVKNKDILKYAIRIHEKNYKLMPDYFSEIKYFSLLKKSICEFELKDYKNSLNTLNTIFQKQKDNSYMQTYIFLSLNYFMLNNKTKGSYWKKIAYKKANNNQQVIDYINNMFKKMNIK